MHVNVESVTNPDPQIQKRLILAIDLAYHAGQKTLEWFSNPLLEVRHKSDRSPVTVADEMAESFVRQSACFRHFLPMDSSGRNLDRSRAQAALTGLLTPLTEQSRLFVAYLSTRHSLAADITVVVLLA